MKLHMNSFKLIKSIPFSSLDAAEHFLGKTTEYGTVETCPYGVIAISNKEELNTTHKTYESLFNGKRYNFSILSDTEGKKVKVNIYKTNMNPMVTAAQIGDLPYLKKHFTTQLNVFAKSISIAIQYKQFNIVEYLVESYPDEVKKLQTPSITLSAIRENDPKLLEYLLNKGFSLPYEYLAHTLHNNSLSMLVFLEKYLMLNHHLLEFTPWYHRLLKNKENETIAYAKKSTFFSK